MTGEVDVLVVLHNSRRWITGLLAGLSEVSISINVYFLDNASTDGTADLLAEALPSLGFRAYVLPSIRNNGFARGVNLLAAQSRAELLFLLNPDTRLEKNCLETLVACARSDPRVGICDARQSPREHPKAWDRATGETTWCSGAAALIRREAFDQAGGFDERLFFMYCEDIDLSWRLWLKGWKCVYVPAAVVQHFTQDVLPGKRRTAENYFSFRNSLFLYYRYGNKKEDRKVLWSFLRRRLFSRAYTLRSKALFAIALVDHIRYISFFHGSEGRGRYHPWVRLRETSLFH